MKIRCIALDLDQTTLDGDGRLSPANRAALEHAISQDIHIVIASGRPYAALPEDVLSVHGIEYAITSNGAAVYHLPTGHCLHRCTLTPVSVEAVSYTHLDVYKRQVPDPYRSRRVGAGRPDHHRPQNVENIQHLLRSFPRLSAHGRHFSYN